MTWRSWRKSNSQNPDLCTLKNDLEEVSGADAVFGRYVVGPSTSRSFWCNRVHLETDRGPSNVFTSRRDSRSRGYLDAIEVCELEVINACASGHNPTNAECPLAPSEHVNVLEIWELAVPRLCPDQEFQQSMPCHQDLSLGSIFVSEGETPSLGCIIDWQGVFARQFPANPTRRFSIRLR